MPTVASHCFLYPFVADTLGSVEWCCCCCFCSQPPAHPPHLRTRCVWSDDVGYVICATSFILSTSSYNVLLLLYSAFPILSLLYRSKRFTNNYLTMKSAFSYFLNSRSCATQCCFHHCCALLNYPGSRLVLLRLLLLLQWFLVKPLPHYSREIATKLHIKLYFVFQSGGTSYPTIYWCFIAVCYNLFGAL